MTLDQLKADQQNLVLQRAMLKDQIEGLEKALGQVSFTIQVLEAQAKEESNPDSE